MSLYDRGWGHRSEDIAVPIHATEGAPKLDTADLPSYAVEYADGSFDRHGPGAPHFKILAATPSYLERLLALDAYSLATEFVRGGFSVEGDLVAAVRFYRARPHSRIQSGILAAIAKFGIGRLETWFQTKGRAARNIRFHYDQSNDFYRQFLDSRMVYSCAYFKEHDQSLDDAQLRKIEHICRKLDFKPGETFLDVGCGWGGLITHAAAEHGAISTGCTLSAAQFDFARELAAERGLGESLRVELSDYRDVEGPFDKIASVGMFEHVGRRRMKKYFDKLHRLLQPGGLLLNHGIMRPENAKENAETLFMRRKVFPGGEIPCLSDVIHSAEGSGFEVLDVENLRPHYALTCRAWVDRLQENAAQCLRYVDRSVYQTWLLAFAASAVCFQDGLLNLNQLLLYRPGNPSKRPFTREYIYE
ncbi:MAG: cyclopropane-fatty-acyl-phospholipid synthase family protein [Candidatus Acidiferrales bacterium]